MTDSAARPPREWWMIVLKANGLVVLARPDQNLGTRPLHEAEEKVHVIEHSAYQALLARVQELEADLKHMEQLYQEELNARR